MSECIARFFFFFSKYPGKMMLCKRQHAHDLTYQSFFFCPAQSHGFSLSFFFCWASFLGSCSVGPAIGRSARHQNRLVACFLCFDDDGFSSTISRCVHAPVPFEFSGRTLVKSMSTKQPLCQAKLFNSQHDSTKRTICTP